MLSEGTNMSTTNSSYSAIARLLHWLIAFLIIGQFIGGWLMTHEGVPESMVYDAFQLHKSFGFLVLVLSLIRLIWRLMHRPPPLPAGMNAWEILVSKVTHIVFYGLMIGLPLTGWIHVSASPLEIPTVAFGILPVPHLPVPIDGAFSELFGGFHEFLAFSTLGLLALHVGAALKHHFMEQDDVLIRMSGAGIGKFLAMGFAGLAFLGIFITMVSFTGGEEEHDSDETHAATQSAPASVTQATGEYNWQIIPEETLVEVAVFAEDAPRQARFTDISGVIQLDPDAPEITGLIDVTIKTLSIESDDHLTVNSAVNEGWLNIGRFPDARFQSDMIRKDGDGGYVATGALTLKGISLNIDLPFTLEISGDQARAEGGITINRLDFDIGRVDTEDPETVINIRVSARKG